MARKEVNIGTTGNDATGDSIRTAFGKVNQNFTELYAALGLGGGLNFQNLDNTPNTITSNKVIATNTLGDAIIEKEITGDGLTIDNSTDPTKIIIRNTGTELVRDTSPQLGGTLDANAFQIENVANPTKNGDAANKQYVDNTFLDAAGDTATGAILLTDGAGNPKTPNVNSEAANKQYVDTKVALAGDIMTGPLLLSETPAFDDNNLQAATKAYVDRNSFTSTNNVFVSKSGRTEAQMLAAGVDQSQIGRANSYAFNTVREALFYCERIIKGDIVLKDQGLFTGNVYWKVPGEKPGPYTINLAADGTEDLTNVLANKLLVDNRRFVQEETVAYITHKIATATLGSIWDGFTYNEEKCYRDIGLIIDAVSFDLTYVGNSRTVDAAASYYDGVTSRIAGQEQQTVDAINFAKTLILNYVLTNTAWAPIRNTGGFTQFIDTAVIAETDANTVINSLMTIVTDVITTGLSALPTKTGGQGRETNIPIPEITLFIESGVYEEYCPMVVPENVSVKGDEFRRTVIQPLIGVRPPQRALDLTFERGDLQRYDGTVLPKEARFRKHYDSQYSRADTYSGSVNQAGDTEIAIKDISYAPLNGTYFTYNGTTYYIKGISFDPLSVGDNSRASCTLYSDINTTTPTTLQDTIPNNTVIELKKLNQHMDVFLMNNATINRNISVRRHQGFVNVLDPEGQILTKSPYTQTVSSFSGQGGGGQYVDGNAGVQYGTVVNNPASGFTITLQGLVRQIQLPTTFLYQDSRNFVSGVSDFEKFTHRVIGATAPIDDGLGSGTFKQTLTLAADSEIKSRQRTNLAGDIPQGTEIRIETAGNKSMTCNDYTQINSDGFGLIATNAGLIEAVSVFTYYCNTSYWARNGGQIRSLNGSSCYGLTGIKAEGSDPNENIQAGQTFFRHVNATKTGSPDPDYSQTVKADTDGASVNISGNLQLKIRDFDYMPFEDSRLTLTAYSTNSDTTEYSISSFAPERINVTAVSIASTCKVTTASNHIFRNGSVVVLDGLDGNGFTTIDGAYYIKTNDGGANPSIGLNEFELYTDSGLTSGFDSTAVQDGGYGGSGADAAWGGAAVLTLNTEINIGTGVQIPDGSDILLTIGKKVLLRDITDAPRVLPSSALNFLGAGIDDQVFRILNVERFDVEEPSGTISNVQEHLLNLIVPPSLTSGTTATVTTRISTMRATGHDFLNIGWGNYADSNYPNNIFGAPEGRLDFSADQAQEAVEVGAGRVFYASTDQDGNFRVGDFFRVNQGDGSVELNANIGLTNVDSLKFTKGTSIDEFSTDAKMQGQSDDAVPTENTVVTYINSAIIGQHEDGSAFPQPTTTGGQTGGVYGLLNRAGYNNTNLSWNRMNGDLNMNSNQITNIAQGTQNDHAINKLYADNVFRGGITDSERTDVEAFTMLNDSTLDTGAIDMNGNRIKSLRDPQDGTDAVTKDYADTRNIIGNITGVTISGSPNNTDILMFTGNNSVDGLGNPIQGAVNVALDTTTDSVSGSRTFGEPSGTGSDIRLIRAGNTLEVALASGSIKNTDVSTEANIAQSKLAMNLAGTRASANAGGREIATVTLNNPIRITTTVAHDLVNGDTVTVSEVTGTVELNGNTYYVSKVDATNFDLYSDSGLTTTVNGTTGFTAYINDGFVTNARLIQASSGLASFDEDKFTITNGFVELKTSTSVDNGITLDKIRFQNAGTILGVVSNAPSATNVTALTPTQVRTSINVENGADVTDYANVKLAGALMADGTVSMNSAGTPALNTNNVEPRTDNTFDLGTSAKYWNDIYVTTANVRNIKAKDTNGINIQNTAGTDALVIANVVNNSTFTGTSRGLTTARNFSIAGEGVAAATSFDGTANLELNITLDNNALDDQYIRQDAAAGSNTLTGTLNTRALLPTANTTYNIGSTTAKYSNVYATRFEGTAAEAEFADLAENYLGDNTYEPGTVLIFGGQNEVTISDQYMSTRIAGVVSTNPAYLMNSAMAGDFKVPVALQGRVPCKVMGTIRKGDMLVASDVPGVAIASDNPKLGSVIGKALENYENSEVGTVEIVVGRL